MGRLISDMGQELGMNADDVRQAHLDSHAGRFEQLSGVALQNAVSRCKELFDLGSLLQALVAELNNFAAAAHPESLPCLFMTWASANLSEPHIIFSPSDLYRVDVDEALVLACLEQLFLGRVMVEVDEKYRGRSLAQLFQPRKHDANDVVEAADSSRLTMEIKTEPKLPSMRLVTIVGLIALSFWASRINQ